MAQPVWRESVSLDAAADADVHRGPGAAAGVRERGESDAGAVGGAASRDCYSNVDGGEPVAAGEATAGGESCAGAGGRSSCAVDHVLDCGNVYEIHSDDGFSDL